MRDKSFIQPERHEFVYFFFSFLASFPFSVRRERAKHREREEGLCYFPSYLALPPSSHWQHTQHTTGNRLLISESTTKTRVHRDTVGTRLLFQLCNTTTSQPLLLSLSLSLSLLRQDGYIPAAQNYTHTHTYKEECDVSSLSLCHENSVVKISQGMKIPFNIIFPSSNAADLGQRALATDREQGLFRSLAGKTVAPFSTLYNLTGK